MTAPLDLAAVKARCAACKVSHACTHENYGCNRCESDTALSAADVPALVDEVERLAAENARLRAVRDVAAEYVTMTVEYDGSDAWAACNDKLKAALRAAGGA